MTQAAIKHEVTLETTTCSGCHIVFAMPDYMVRQLRASGGTFYCPSGHSLHWPKGPTEADRLRKMLDEANRSKTELVGDLHQARAGWNEAEVKLAKSEKKAKQTLTRIHAGVCPCCNRTFQNLARHMATKHKDEKV